MPSLNGTARYLALRGAETDSAGHWPPKSEKPLGPDHAIYDTLLLSATEAGWQVMGAAAGPAPLSAPDHAITVTAQTVLGLIANDGAASSGASLLGVRAVQPDGETQEYVSHVVVLRETTQLRRIEKTAVVAPIDLLTLSAYVEHGTKAEAVLDLRISPEELAHQPIFLPDKLIEKLAKQALDVSVPTLRQRHDIIVETVVGRVALYGHAQLTSTGDAAHAELERTPGVLEVADYVVYSERLQQQVQDSLAKKGLGDITVLMEHDLAELHGVVPDRKAYHAAREAALKVPGVLGVVSNSLLVEEPPATEPAAPEAHDAQPASTTPAKS
jgi:osmotically-inducible protein OsmY